MTHPTDDEREAMAALTADQLAQVIRKVDGENTMGAGALAEAILAALEPAPDHGEWDAAIESAAKVAERRSTDGLSDDDPYNEGWRRCATITTAAIRSLKKARTMTDTSNWQPIETAPRDGTHILAAWVPVNLPRWVRETIMWMDGEWVATWSHGPILSRPTHWVPLPDPPRPMTNTPDRTPPADHAEWDAAIEAAAKVAFTAASSRAPATDRKKIAAAIRDLKKGQSND